MNFQKKDLDYLINHIVFPFELPNKDDSFNEHLFLKFIKNVVQEIGFAPSKNLQVIIDLLDLWRRLQTNPIDEENLYKVLSSLTNTDKQEIIPLYVKNQNTCILIHTFPKEFDYSATFSYFQVSLENTIIMSNVTDIEFTYPEASFYIDNMNILQSKCFCDLLADLCNQSCPDSYAKTVKSDHENEEVRDVPNTNLISEWLTHVLISNKFDSNYSSSLNNHGVRINKKLRDEVNYEKTIVPFRRSGQVL
jgi:hypothetical protein